jgi:uncharacterized protein DUF2513
LKRDMDLVRRILIEIEERNDFDDPYVPEIEGKTEHEIFYHIKIMHEAGLIEASNWSGDGGPHWLAKSLTNTGHDFLDAARNENLWAKAKSKVLSSGGVLTIEALKIGLAMAVQNAVTGNGS